MKIKEITDKNAAWAQLFGIDIPAIYRTYTTIIDSWPVILRSNSLSLIQTHKQNLSNYLEILDNVSALLNNFPEQTDQDIQKLLVDLPHMQADLRKLL
jgi:elongation factor P--beta-lysine ligase